MSEETPPTLLSTAAALRDAVDRLRFSAPVTHVYNPLAYAWPLHQQYLERFGQAPKQVLFLGMNPGPFGMVQTGVPFGEVAAVRDWMGLSGEVGRPKREHELRPVEGLACARSEISGRRLWGLIAERFDSAEIFFRDHFVANYCPLAFVSATGANLTPDRLSGRAVKALYEICDRHLATLIAALRPRHLVGIGRFAVERLRQVAPEAEVVLALHPSPASPAANRDWAGTFTRQLVEAGVWTEG